MKKDRDIETDRERQTTGDRSMDTAPGDVGAGPGGSVGSTEHLVVGSDPI